MKLLKDIPQSGQFVQIWNFNNKLWSATLKWSGDILLRYDDETDDFVENEDLNDDVDCKYIVDL